MVNYELATATQRRLNLVRRAIEVTAVLGLAFVTTVFHVAFGWVTLLWKSSPRNPRVPANTVVFPAVKTSREY